MATESEDAGLTVTVVIPFCETYTPEKMLTEAIESADRQAVDTAAVVIEDEEERGPAWARNVGLDRAETRYVAFLDADDVWHPDKLQTQLAEMERTGAALCVDGDHDWTAVEFTGKLLTGEAHSLTSSILLDTEQVSVRFDESLERREDHLFMMEAATAGGVCFTPSTFEARDHGDGFSNYVALSPEQIEEFFHHVVDVVPEAVRFESAYYRTSYTYLGRRHHFDGAYGDAVGYYLQALRHDLNIRPLGALVLTMLAVVYDYPVRLYRGLVARGTHE